VSKSVMLNVEYYALTNVRVSARKTGFCPQLCPY